MDNVETLARKLISIDSQSHVSNTPLAEFVAEYLEPFANEIERIEYTDEGGRRKVSLVALVGKGTGGLALSAHMDTVPGLGWRLSHKWEVTDSAPAAVPTRHLRRDEDAA